MSKKILVVDDEDMIRELIVLELEDNGFNCIEARDARDALKKLESTQFDLILTDAKMPEISGIEFIKILKKDKFSQDTPVILMSGHTGVSDRELSDLGLAAKIQKPFQVSDIIELIKKIS